MKKLFYILPEFHENTSTHFRYNVELLEEIALQSNVWLFIEKGVMPRVKNIQNIYVGKFKFLPLRLIERLLVFSAARAIGYNNFYSHYAYLSALIAALICRISFGKMFFWHCEMRGEYESKDCNLCDIPAKVSIDWPFRAVIKLCNTLVTCSPLMKNYYHETFAVPLQKIKVISNWVDIKKLSNSTFTSTNTILFLHWLSPRKGSRILPEIFESVKKRMPDVKFIVAGEGPDFKFLQNEFKKRKLNVEMLGATPNTEISKLFKRACLLLNPSREEEFGRVIIEAMAAGLPVVSTKTFGAQAILTKKQFEYTFDYESPGDGAEKCLEILASKKLQASLRAEGLKRVKFFDKERVVEKFRTLF